VSTDDRPATGDTGRADPGRLTTTASRFQREQTKLRVHGYDVWSLTETARIDFIRWNVLAAIHELGEALDEVGWKPWGTSRHFNRDAYMRELADVQLFLDNLLLTAVLDGQSSSDLGEEFDAICLEKIENSERRQRDGYHGFAEKCDKCARDILSGDYAPMHNHVTTENGVTIYWQAYRCACGMMNHVVGGRREARGS
jgi:hypothetical protein